MHTKDDPGSVLASNRRVKLQTGTQCIHSPKCNIKTATMLLLGTVYKHTTKFKFSAYGDCTKPVENFVISSRTDAHRNWLQKTDNCTAEDSATSAGVRWVDMTAQFVQKPAHNNNACTIKGTNRVHGTNQQNPTQWQNNRQILKAMRWRHLPEPYLCTALPLSRLQVWQMREKKQDKHEGKST